MPPNISKALAKILGIGERKGLGVTEREGISALEREAAEDIYKMNPSLRREDAVDTLSQVDDSLIPRDAQSSARVFEEQMPNFETIGPPRTEIPTGAQNFQLKGDPYSGKVPARIEIPKEIPPKSINLPALRTAEETAKRVIPELADDIVNKALQPADDIVPFYKNIPQNKLKDYLSKYGKGAGVLAAGAGASLPSSIAPTGEENALAAMDESEDEVLPTPIIASTKQSDDETEDITADKLASEDSTGTSESDNIQVTKPSPDKIAGLMELLGADTEGTKDKLSEAQKQKNLAILVNQLGKAGEIIGSSISRTKPVAQELFDQNIKLAGQGVDDLKERIGMEERDPGSAVSANYRKFLARYGYTAPENLSAEQIKNTLLPAIEKEALQKEKLEAAKVSAKEKAEDRKVQRDATTAYRDVAQKSRNERHAKGQLESMKNRAIAGGGVVGNQIRQKVAYADNIFATVGADEKLSEDEIEKLDPKEFDKVPKIMVVETGMELNRLLTNAGVPAQKSLEKIIPKNILMDATAIEDYLTSKLNPAQQGEFVKQALKTAARVKSIGKKQNTELMRKYVSGTEHIRNSLPDDYDAALMELGLDPNDFKSSKKKETKVESKQKDSGFVLMSKDGVNFKPIPSGRVKEAEEHGYKQK